MRPGLDARPHMVNLESFSNGIIPFCNVQTIGIEAKIDKICKNGFIFKTVTYLVATGYVISTFDFND